MLLMQPMQLMQLGCCSDDIHLPYCLEAPCSSMKASWHFHLTSLWQFIASNICILVSFREWLYAKLLRSRSLKRPKSALLNSRLVSSLCALLAALRHLNSTFSQSLQSKPLLIFIFLIISHYLDGESKVHHGTLHHWLLYQHHQHIPGTSWIACVLLCCPSNR